MSIDTHVSSIVLSLSSLFYTTFTDEADVFINGTLSGVLKMNEQAVSACVCDSVWFQLSNKETGCIVPTPFPSLLEGNPSYLYTYPVLVL